MRHFARISVFLLALTACDATGVGSTTSVEPPNTVAPISTTHAPEPPASSTTSTLPPTTTPPTDAPCAVGETVYTASQILATFGATVGDAERLSTIRWAAYEDCERLVLDFLTSDGAPASIMGETAVSLLRDFNVIRIALSPEVETTQIDDILVDTAMIRRAYVVRLANGALVVDIHLSGPVEARAFGLPEPARSVLDLRPVNSAETLAYPSVSDNLVVFVSPSRSGQRLTVSGYSWGGERIELTYASNTTTITPATDTEANAGRGWYWFETLIDKDPLETQILRLKRGDSTVELQVNAS